jgi:hypothetical protein
MVIWIVFTAVDYNVDVFTHYIPHRVASRRGNFCGSFAGISAKPPASLPLEHLSPFRPQSASGRAPVCGQGIARHPRAAARSTASVWRCRPSASKFDGCSQSSNPPLMTGHSSSVMEYQAVSRLRLL